MKHKIDKIFGNHLSLAGFVFFLAVIFMVACSNMESDADNKETIPSPIVGKWFYFESNGGMLLEAENHWFVMKKVEGKASLPVLMDGAYITTRKNLKITANSITLPVAYTLSSDKKKLTLIIDTTIASYLSISEGSYSCAKKIESTLSGTWLSADGNLKMVYTASGFQVYKKIVSFIQIANGDYELFGDNMLIHSQSPSEVYFALKYKYNTGSSTIEMEIPRAIVTGKNSDSGYTWVTFTKQ